MDFSIAKLSALKMEFYKYYFFLIF